MKSIISILFTFMMIGHSSYGQSLLITDSAATPSICFNDGTISVAASGGSGSYTFSIVGGPTYVNITYPIILPAHDSVFLTMPRGQYTIRVTDGAGDTTYATATIGGTYTFPVITNTADTVYSTCITASVQGGRPPYQFSRSTLGTNTGFGPYQSSASFCNLCNGPNWIRVMDSCSNIFTTNKIYVEVPVPRYSVTNQTVGRTDNINVTLITAGAPPYTYKLSSGSTTITNHTGVFPMPVSCLPDTITATDSCGSTFDTILDLHYLDVTIQSPCRSGDAKITMDSASIGPYTITGTNGTLVTRQNQVTFSSLQVDSPYHFTITDSCGNRAIFNLPACDSIPTDTFFFYPVCPFDSSLHMSHDPVHFCYPVVVSCLSCIPIQTDTILLTPAILFTNIDTGVVYTILIKDNCGFIDTTTYKPDFAPLGIDYSIISCDDISVSCFPPGLAPPVHFSLFDQGALIDSITADQAIFYHLPVGTYQIKATQSLCDAATITVGLPALGGLCIVAMFDSTCTPSYAIVQYLTAVGYTDVYTLVNTATSASYRQLLPSPFNDALVFYDVPVGNYNLVSDSGCSTPFVLPPFAQYTVSATSTRQCTGQALIKATYTPSLQSCNTAQSPYFVLLKDNQYIANSTTGDFIVSDTGYYVVRLYMTNPLIFGLFSPQDTLCPLDTTLVYVNNVAIPNLVSRQVILVCGHIEANIPYTIFGGTPPYTVQILGYPTQTDYSTTDTFPGVYPGIYTIIVSDSCGISRSFSVSVIDTCSPACTVSSQFSISDTVTCTYTMVSMLNQSTGATHYLWDIDRNVYAYATDTSFVPTSAGTYTITLYAYIGVCEDSAKRTVTVEDTIYSTGRQDTALCSPFTLRLNSHMANTVWSTGASDSIITVTNPGLYEATVSNICGSAIDTVNVAIYPLVQGLSLTEDKSALCERAPDSVMLSASIDSSGQQTVTFRWSTGVGDTGVFSSGIFVYQPGPYTVTVGYCPLTADIAVDSIACDSECIRGLAFPDIFSPNGDGRNDTFFIPHICEIIPFEMHIYNRWGELVFESPDINKGWDGKYKGDPEPEEVYWMWLSLTLPDGKVIYRSGSVTLVR